MYTISSDILNRFQSGQKQYARLTFSNNSTIENDRIIQGTFSINRYVVTGESIGIGSTVAAELSFVLRNGDAAYTSDDFLDEEVFAEIGVMDSNNTIQYVPFGYYTFDDATESATTINLSALDRMLKFEKTVGTITFPITVNNLLAAACTACSVTLDSSVTGLVNGTYSVTELPDSVKTWREVLQWICEITGTNAWITRDGKLKLSWFATSSSATLTTANRLNSSVGKDVISITGVTILANNVKYTAGTNTRPLTITDNGLISHDHQAVADAINTARNGYSYSSFTATAMPLPQLDPMDVITFVKGASNILCPVTDITFKLSGMTTLGCKSDQLAHGRSYGLQDATFYAHNIAANAVTADKISVDDLAALRATIGGFSIGSDRIVHYYKDNDNNEYYLRIMSPIYGASTQGIEVLVKPNGGSWDNAFAVTYSGWMMSKNCDIEGVVKATSGLIGNISISNGAIESQNGNFKVTAAGNLEAVNGRFSGRIESTEGAIGGFNLANNKIYKRSGATPQEAQYYNGVEIVSDYEPYIAVGGRTGRLTPQGEVEVVQIAQNRFGVFVERGYDDGGDAGGDFYPEYSTQLDGEYISITGGNNETYIDPTSLTIGNKDILRTHQSLVGGWFLTGTITANSNLNTGALCKVGRWNCSTAVAQTLTNCPVRTEFTMTVHAPTQTGDLGNESGTWTYRVREIETWNGIKYRQFAQTAGTANVWTFGAWQLGDGASAINGTLTANTGSFSESYCRQAGRVVDIHAWLENLSTSTQTHERAIRVTGVSLPSVPIRFTFTCWLNNNIAAYAGYGVLDTSGYITFVKAVANSNKVSFAISYVV